MSCPSGELRHISRALHSAANFLSDAATRKDGSTNSRAKSVPPGDFVSRRTFLSVDDCYDEGASSSTSAARNKSVPRIFKPFRPSSIPRSGSVSPFPSPSMVACQMPPPAAAAAENAEKFKQASTKQPTLRRFDEFQSRLDSRTISKGLSPSNRGPIECQGRTYHRLDTTSKVPINFTKTSVVRENKNKFEDYYESGKVIGEGAFGKVYACKHKMYGGHYAVKRVKKDKVVDWDSFVREVSFLSELDHPHIIKLVEFFQEGDVTYLILELCDGPDLIDKINEVCVEQTRFSEREARVILRHMTKAIHGCHINGVVHNDIKPENFKYRSPDPDASLMLIDFGIARRFRNRRQKYNRDGTPYYWPPEMIQDENRLPCPAGDVWSVGVLFYVMLTGSVPYESNELDDMLVTMKRFTKYDLLSAKKLPHVTDDGRDLLCRMLAENPKDRITAKELLTHPWMLRSVSMSKSIAPGMDKLYVGDFAAEGCMTVMNVSLDDFNNNFIDELRDFTKMPALKRLGLLCVAHLLTDTRQEDNHHVNITRTFRHLDRAGEGRLTVKHVREHMEHRGEPVPEDLEEIFRNIEDLTRQGNDEGDPGPCFTTFIAATMKRHLYKDKLVLKEVFTLLAQGGNEITAITLAAVFNQKDPIEQAEIIQELDEDAAGINWNTFNAMF